MRATSLVQSTCLPRSASAGLSILAAGLLLLFATPREARAQSDAVRILAGRVLGGIDRDRNRDVWGDRDISRRDRDQWEREQREREKWCRKHGRDRRCDDDRGFESRRGSAWCLDRDRNGRCDVNRRDDRGRGPWWDDSGDRRSRGRRN